jgi:hypothetical protein
MPVRPRVEHRPENLGTPVTVFVDVKRNMTM